MTKNDTTSNMDQTRLMNGAAGGALILMGLKKRGFLGLLMTGAGGYLAYKAATGNDPVMAAAGLSGNASAAKPIFVEHSVVVDRPAQQVYDYWRKLENLPHIMSHLESVTALDDKRSRWVAKAPLGTHVFVTPRSKKKPRLRQRQHRHSARPIWAWRRPHPPQRARDRRATGTPCGLRRCRPFWASVCCS